MSQHDANKCRPMPLSVRGWRWVQARFRFRRRAYRNRENMRKRRTMTNCILFPHLFPHQLWFFHVLPFFSVSNCITCSAFGPPTKLGDLDRPGNWYHWYFECSIAVGENDWNWYKKKFFCILTARRKFIVLILPFSAGPECTEGQNPFCPGSKAPLETCKVNTGHNGFPGKVWQSSERSHGVKKKSKSYCGWLGKLRPFSSVPQKHLWQVTASSN